MFVTLSLYDVCVFLQKKFHFPLFLTRKLCVYIFIYFMLDIIRLRGIKSAQCLFTYVVSTQQENILFIYVLCRYIVK